MSRSAIALLESQASEFGVLVTARTGTRLEISVPVPLPDGQAPSYQITAEVTGRTIAARETIPTRLPAFCPERHINYDGTFCLEWTVVDQVQVDDETDAWNWWARLIKFLRLQERAAGRRLWPDHRAWAHGGAATHQFRAERSASRLGQLFLDDLALNRLTVLQRGNGANGPGLRVLRDGKRIFAVWVNAKRAVNLRRPCICEKGAGRRPSILRNCGDHANAAVELALALRDRENEEARFWLAYEGSPCCGTMDNCPLLGSRQRNTFDD